MPLVRIDLSSQHAEGFAQQVGEVVYQAMREHINVPEDDKFQVITRHDRADLVTPKSYLGIEYSDGIIFIQITLNEGRSTELKKNSIGPFVMVWSKNSKCAPKMSGSI